MNNRKFKVKDMVLYKEDAVNWMFKEHKDLDKVPGEIIEILEGFLESDFHCRIKLNDGSIVNVLQMFLKVA